MFKLPRFALWCLLATCSSACAEERSDELTFERHIRPILRAHCLDCHGAGEELAGGLDLRLVRFMERGGESGAAIARGDVANSLLLQRVIDGEMPPGNHPVPPAEIEKLKDEGAKLQQELNQYLGSLNLGEPTATRSAAPEPPAAP